MTAAGGNALGVSRTLDVARPPDEVWEFVRDMGRWASQMPGYISHEALGADDSVWTLQVDIGPFKRPVAIDVHVIEWRGPHHVHFELKGRHDPFRGAGSFESEVSAGGTRIVLDFAVTPTGSMARVLAPMVPPILEAVADQFSANLRAALQPQARTVAPVPPALKPARAVWRLFLDWLRGRYRVH